MWCLTLRRILTVLAVAIVLTALISYSNHGYALAAYVVEAVSGLPFDRYVRDRIVQPLGMERSGYLLDADSPEGLAWGYNYVDGQYQPQPVDYDQDCPGGAVWDAVWCSLPALRGLA